MLLEAMPHAAWVVTLADRRVVAVNAAAEGLFGSAGCSLVGASALSLCASPEDLLWWESDAGLAEPLFSDTVVATVDGRALHVSRSIGRLGDDGRHALVVLHDRSAERRIEEQREELLSELQATLEATADGILVTDRAGRMSVCNRRFAEIWAVPLALLEADDDAGIPEFMRLGVRDPVGYAHRLAELSESTLTVACDRIELHGGQVLERVTRPLLRGGMSHGRVWSFRDLTDRIAAAARIEELAVKDLLTGLPNRRALTEGLSEATDKARRTGGSYALLLIDLDRFRQINDSLGHDIGDRVLQTVAQRMAGCLRADDLLARLGGDQFALIVQPADTPAAEATARRVLNVVAQPIELEGAIFTLTCSIGMAIAPAQGSHADELVRHADGAMRAVKASGRANFMLHQARAEGDRRLHMKLDHAMRQALVSRRFRLLYQPQVSMADGRIVGAEALLRWRDPEMGELPPAQFIPVAEQSGFIVPIGDWVLGQAVRQAALWHGRGHSLPIGINVSALQFRQPQFVERVASVLAVSGLPPQLLELELTESILVHDADEALQRLHSLARLGVRLSIDDFGTGYSSLAYLKRFPIDRVKIDRSFISGLPGDDSDAGIVRAILQMARALGMTAIAEGVETEPQRQFLQAEGCAEFQGWLFAPAMDALSFEQRLLQSLPAPPPPSPRIRLVGR